MLRGVMSLQDLKDQVMQLQAHERLELVSAIVNSLQDPTPPASWQFLVARPHPWRKQLAIKDRTKSYIIRELTQNYFLG